MAVVEHGGGLSGGGSSVEENQRPTSVTVCVYIDRERETHGGGGECKRWGRVRIR